MSAADVIAERNRWGAWQCATVHNGYRVSMIYVGYTKRAAIREFVAAVKAGEL